MIYVVDTHPLVWFFEANSKLTDQVRRILSFPTSQIVIPTIVMAEIIYLYNKRRINTAGNQVIDFIGRCENCSIYPLDEAVLENIPTGLDIHDGLIVATARLFQVSLGEEVTVLTKDRKITESGWIRTLW